ncbi:hypothetical protein [Rhizobacter fulvus]
MHEIAEMQRVHLAILAQQQGSAPQPGDTALKSFDDGRHESAEWARKRISEPISVDLPYVRATRTQREAIHLKPDFALA